MQPTTTTELTMTAMARHFDNLGTDFDERWKRSSRGAKRELIAELRELYIFLEEEDMPLLAGAAAASRSNSDTDTSHINAATSTQTEQAKTSSTKKPKAEQGSLFSDNAAGNTQAAGAPRKDNPFLPKSVLDRLHESQTQASAGLRELMHSNTSPAVTGEKADLERELRLKLGPVVEILIEAQMEHLKSELRVRMRAEMDRLIAEQLRNS